MLNQKTALSKTRKKDCYTVDAIKQCDAALLAFNRKQFSEKDFTLIKQEYHLKFEKCADYYKVFYDELIARKMDIFKFVQQYYRCFMGCKSVKEYPIFEF